MDDYEAMVARARERREALTARLKETEIVSPNKRHVETENIDPATDDEDSPSKRCCNDTREQFASAMETVQEVEMKASPCRTKLAALAQDINSWEDDASRPTIKKVDSTKKVWKPPTEKSKLSSNTNNPASVKSVKLRTGASEKKAFGNSHTNDSLELSVPRNLQFNQRGACSSRNDIHKVGCGSAAARQKSVAIGNVDMKRKTGGTDNLTESSGLDSCNIPNAATLTDTNCSEATKNEQATKSSADEKSSRRLSDVNEPTRQPVSARMAAWRKKIVSNEEATTAKPVLQVKQNSLSTIAERKQVVDKPVVLQHSSSNVKMSGFSSSLRHDINGSNSSQKVPKTSCSPKESGARQQAMPKSSVVETGLIAKASPKKFGLATVGIQEKLSAMCENWKQNEIAEKSRQERAAEIALLENRWKNGILVEKDAQTTSIASSEARPICAASQGSCVSTQGAIPLPPPLPNTWRPSQAVAESKSSCQWKSTSGDTASSTNNPANETGSKTLSKKVASILESNLLAMGFSKSGEGTVATLPRQVEEPTTIDSKSRSLFGVVATSASVRKKPAVDKETADRLDTAVATSTPNTNLGGLYGLVKEHVQVMRNSSSSLVGPERSGTSRSSSVADLTNCVEHTPTVYFCEAKNIVIAASSPEESFCSNEDQPSTTGNDEPCDCDEESSMNSTDDLETITESNTAKKPACHIANNTDCDSEDLSSYSPKQMTGRSNGRNVNRYYSYRHRHPLKMGLGNTVTASYRETDSDTSFSFDDSNHVSTSTPQSSCKKIINASSDNSIEDIHEWGSRALQSSPTVVQSTPTSRQEVRHKELNRDPVEYRHAATLSNQRDQRSRSYTNSPKRAPPTIISQERLEHQRVVTVSKKSVDSQIQGLKEMAAEEESVLVQASNALSHCIKSAAHNSSSSFVGTAEAVECHRLLLVALKKRESFLTEMKRLREGQGSYCVSKALGSLILSNIRVPIKPDFIAKIGSIHDSSVHHFVLMLRNGVNLMTSRRFSTQEPLMHGCLSVPGEIKLNCVPCDFSPSVCLEVYAMVVSRDPSLSLTPKKQRLRVKESENSSGIRGTSFVSVAQLYLTIDSLSKTHFRLSAIASSSSLHGTIHAKVALIPEINTFFRGYLNIYADESSSGWSRYWCVLYNDRITMWNHRTAELYKEAICLIDLRQCITERAVAGCFGSSTHPTCVELVVIRQAVGGNSRVKHHSQNITTARYWLIADSTQECAVWCARLNRVLDDLREWHPYAVPSVRSPLSDVQHSSGT